MDKLLSYIEHYYQSKVVSTSLSYDEQKELEFLEKFVYNMAENDNFTPFDLDMHDLVIAYIRAENKDDFFESIQQRVNKLNFNKINDYDSVLEFTGYLREFLEKDCCSLVFKVPFDYDKSSNEASILKEEGLDITLEKMHKWLKKTICQTEEQRKIFFELLEKHSISVTTAMMSIGALNLVKNNISFMAKPKENKPKEMPDLSQINLSTFTNSRGIISSSFNKKDITYEDVAEIMHINEMISSCRKRIEELKRIPLKREKENKNTTRKKDKVIGIIKSFDFSKPINLTKGMYESITDERIKYLILRSLITHNLKFQEKTIERLEKEENISKIEKLFKKSCFSFNDLDSNMKQNLSQYGNIDDIEKMLNLFTESKLKIYNDSFPIYDVLLLSKPSIVANINKMITSNVISQEFVLNNPSIFVQEMDEMLLDKTLFIKETKYNTLVNNIYLLKERKINTLDVSKSNSNGILLRSNDEVNSILSLINDYELDYTNGTDFSLLDNPKLIKIVDRFIELGLGSFIKDNTYLINEDALVYLDRMELYKSLGVNLLNDGKLSSKITTGCFRIGKNVISDEDLKDYIPNSINRYLDADCYKAIEESHSIEAHMDSIKELKEFESSNLEYNINGIIISKQKVLRNMTILEEKCPNIDRQKQIFNSIIYGSILDEEKLDNISQSLNESIKKLEKK